MPMSFPYRILLLSGACVKFAVPTLFRFILRLLREHHVSYIKTFFSHLLGVTWFSVLLLLLCYSHR